VKYYARIGEKVYECVVEERDGALFVTVGGRRYEADLRAIGTTRVLSLLIDGRSFEFTMDGTPGEVELSGGSGHFRVTVEDARTHAAREKTADARGAGGPRVIKALMPGIVRELKVGVGDAVAKGGALLILEAMKMQNEIRADRDGSVTKLHVEVGSTVEKGAKLVEIE